ncbi:MAG TPA: ABC transporter substrate-binding protein [Actinomycetota bacterium]|jgi:multiple sugar transport system substrate-binding protein|nr:ABC transporter substrate-binding protein [Actinomycetota bacterium]
MRSQRKGKLIVPAIASVVLIAVACTSGSSGSSSASGADCGQPTQLTMWHGYGKVIDNQGQTNYEAKSLTDLVDQYNAMNTGVCVNLDYIGTNDHALEKLTVALNAGEQPDITYQYGTSMPQLAGAPGIMDLTDKVQDPTFKWNDFVAGARDAATVDGHVLGIPALIDNLAIVYNKDLFKQAGISPPTADWTWDDFRAAAAALTDPSKKQYGFAFPVDGTEDTVWHYDAMLWEAGGDILNADNTKAAFNSDAGVQALTTLQQMAVTDKSVFLDQQNTGKIEQLFNAGNIGMLVTGPWDLSSFPDVNYGVQIMPTYPGGTHATIAGPDMWVMFDNNGHGEAAWQFMQWFTAAQQIKADSLESGHLPTRNSVVKEPGFLSAFDKKFPGEGLFAQNLANVTKARPVITSYDQISTIMGQAIVKVMLGQGDPKTSLDDAANQVNQVLAGG